MIEAALKELRARMEGFKHYGDDWLEEDMVLAEEALSTLREENRNLKARIGVLESGLHANAFIAKNLLVDRPTVEPVRISWLRRLFLKVGGW